MTIDNLPSPARSLAFWLRSGYPGTLAASDVFGLVAALAVAGLLRNEVRTVEVQWSNLIWVTVIAVVAYLGAAHVLYLYRNRYRVATFEELSTMALCWAIALIPAVITNAVFFTQRVPSSIVVAGMTLAGAWMVTSRVIWRLLRRAEARPDAAGRIRVLVFGAGDGGTQVIKSMHSDTSSRYVPVGLIDDDPRKRNRSIEGVRVLGSTNTLASLGWRADLLLIAVPSAGGDLVSRLSAKADAAGLDVLILPTTTELFGMMASIEEARPLEITDLLGRDEVEIDGKSVSDYLTGKVVLVTGAGGSIGSELCRQILKFEPERLVMVDRDETALQGVQLSVTGHGLLDDENLVLANIRDRDRVFEVFEQHRPSIVFHAAALKHLPLLESHPREGLLTNVFGTRNVLEAAKSVGVTHFVNISTDKAANPTSVLGTTKRIAESLTLMIGQESPGEYMSVRFGNVIGSRGSVLPAFEQQIASGGPVTVTHPEVTRYFMSIPEASRLVLQAGAIGQTGETLVLDMGEPMKIVNLAEKLIQHHNSNAKIVFTGLRPNEKLHEVLGHDGESMTKGVHSRIWHADAASQLHADDPHRLLETSPADLPQELMAWCAGEAQANSVI